MRKSLSFSPFFLYAVAALALFLWQTSPSFAAAQNRIASAISGRGGVVLKGNIHPLVQKAQDMGPAAADAPLPWVTINFRMTNAQQNALTQLLAAQQTPGSPQYHQWLTPEQFGAQFGVSQHDMAAVSAWLRQQGFKINATSRGGQWIAFSGTAGQAEQTFGTQMHTMRLNGETHLANVTEPSVPAALAPAVQAIQGLNDFKLQPRSQVRRVKPDFTSSVSGNHYVAPGDFYTIYDVNPLITAGPDGSGITIAVMGQVDLNTADVAAFRTASGLSATNLPTVKLYGTDPGHPTGATTGPSSNDLDEAQLDVEWSGAVAPNASILFVNSSDVFTSLMNTVDNNLAPIISISYGNCEAGFGGAAGVAADNLIFAQANAQGQTIIGPAGDSGATDCDGGTDSNGNPITTATSGLAVDFPASSPYVTGLGGTSFNEGSGNYWNASNGTNSGSAVGYIPEATWNDTDLYQIPAASSGGGYGGGYGGGGGATVPNGLSAGGGGASAIFAKPTWQTGVGVPNDYARDVPDVSLNASPNHDGYLFCSEIYNGAFDQGPTCTNGTYRDTSGNLDVVGGTSAAAPAFAGILALVEQKIAARVGNANPMIYALANSASYNNVFHDITVGTNASPCTQGSIGCPNGGTIGYGAGVGYDQATGWGSIQAFNLANLWTSVKPAAGLGMQMVSNTTLVVSPVSSSQGTAVTLTATVAAAASGGGTPTGSVQFLVDGSALGSGVAVSNGTATLATTSIGAGDHTMSAVYEGDSTYATSKGTATLTITSATNPDFTISPLSGTITVVAPGRTSGAFPITFTGVNGFSGTVTISLASSASPINPSFGSPAVYNSTANTWTVNVPANAAVTTPLYIGTTPASAITTIGHSQQGTGMARKTGLRLGAAAGGVAFAGMLLLGFPGSRRRRWNSLLALSLLAVLGFASGCGNAYGGGGTTGTNPGTPTGTFTVTVTGTATAGTANLSHSTTLTLVVQ